MIFFTADLHFGSSNIIKYCNRPYKSVDHMNSKLVKQINSRCKSDDVLYHVGDFILYGKEKGVESMRKKPSEFESEINCKVIHFTGNHDSNNKLKSSLLGSYIKISKDITAWVQHYPPWYESDWQVPKADLYICGHVHKAWKTAEYKHRLVINVGCDMWQYRPVSKKEIIKLYMQEQNKKVAL